MSNYYSLTYGSRIVSIVMAVSLIMGWDFDEGYVTELVMTLVWLAGEVANLYGRYRAGGVKWWGGRA